MRPFWKRRGDVADVESQLREQRPEPSSELVDRISDDVASRTRGASPRRTAPRIVPRLAFAGILSVAVLAAVGALGGLDYPVSVATDLAQVTDDDGGQAANDQYEELVTVCPGGSPATTLTLPRSEAEALLARDPDAFAGPCPAGEVAAEEEVAPAAEEEVAPAVITAQGCPPDVTAPAGTVTGDDELAFTGLSVVVLALAGLALVGAGLAIFGVGLSRGSVLLMAALVITAAAAAVFAGGESDELDLQLTQAQSDPLASLPGPVVGETVNLVPCGAHATVNTPGAGGFESVGLPEQVPIGTVVNTRRTPVQMVSAVPQQTASGGQLTAGTEDGTVAFELAAITEGATRTARFSEGKFKILQEKTRRAVTKAKLVGKLQGCRDDEGRGRVLWADGEGLHQTRGQLASATVRGTRWRISDLCDGSTRVKVAEGKVSVKDLKQESTELLNAGESTRIEGP